MAELVDAAVLETAGRKAVEVRVLSGVPFYLVNFSLKYLVIPYHSVYEYISRFPLLHLLQQLTKLFLQYPLLLSLRSK